MIPDLSVLWVIFLVLLLAALLDWLLFRPIARVVQARASAIGSAQELANESAERATAAMAEFDRQTAAARAEVYRDMEQKRRAALNRRTEILTETRHAAEQEIAAATARLQAQATEAKRRLGAEAELLGRAIVERVLGRKAS